MDKDPNQTLFLLEKVEEYFTLARSVCDPIEYQKRQQLLLYSITEVLIDELYHIRGEV
jgi:hypothetical protein